MMRTGLVLGGCVLAVLGGQDAGAAESFDNPSAGATPCLALNRYEVQPTRTPEGISLYQASASVENICGRTLEVVFCFIYAEPVNGADRSCFGAIMRPWSNAQVEAPVSPTRIVSTEYRWRYIPVVSATPSEEVRGLAAARRVPGSSSG
jgi:hypothetical protein